MDVCSLQSGIVVFLPHSEIIGVKLIGISGMNITAKDLFLTGHSSKRTTICNNYGHIGKELQQVFLYKCYDNIHSINIFNLKPNYSKLINIVKI